MFFALLSYAIIRRTRNHERLAFLFAFWITCILGTLLHLTFVMFIVAVSMASLLYDAATVSAAMSFALAVTIQRMGRSSYVLRAQRAQTFRYGPMESAGSEQPEWFILKKCSASRHVGTRS